MGKIIVSAFKEKPKYKATWRSMWLGLSVLLIPPFFGFFAAVIRPLIDPASMEGSEDRLGFQMGFGLVFLSLVLVFFAVKHSLKAYKLGERSWVMWVGLIPSILIGLFWLMMIAGELVVPHSSDAPTVDAPASSATTRLDLSGSGLKRVPSYVFDMTNLLEFDVSNNQLTGALPAEIRQLRNLQVLDASGNKMTGVPAEIGQLSALRDLDLSENQLTGLPLELGNLSNLRRLDLRGNMVSKQDLDAIRTKLTGTEILE